MTDICLAINESEVKRIQNQNFCAATMIKTQLDLISSINNINTQVSIARNVFLPVFDFEKMLFYEFSSSTVF